MRAYILKRNNQQSGPYTTQQLHSMGLMPTDQVRIAGSDIGWSFVDEIQELAPFIVSSSIVTPNGLLSNEDILGESPISGRSSSVHVTPPADDIPTMQPWARIRVDEDAKDNRNPKDNNRKSEPERATPPSSDAKAPEETPDTVKAKGIIDVIVTDDHWIFRDGVKMSLATREDIRVVGEAENGQQLLNLLKHRKPDVILLDITMPVMDGLAALKALRRTDTDTRVIVLSMHEGRSMVTTMMEAGANGYLIKTADPESIYQAIRTCHEKGFFFNELTNLSLLEGLRTSPGKPAEKTERAEPLPVIDRAQLEEFNGGKILEKLTVSRTKEIKEKPRASLQFTLIMFASLVFLVAGIWGGFWLKAHPEWLKLNTLVPEKQENERSATVDPIVNPPQQVLPNTNQSQDSLSTPIQNQTTPGTNEISEDNTSLNDAANGLPATGATDADKLKQLQEKRLAARRAKDSLARAQQLAAQAKPEVHAPVVVEAPVNKPEPPAPAPRKVDVAQVTSQVSANANEYKVGVFGGLSRIEITVHNGSAVALDDVSVEVSYFTSNDNVFQTKIIHSGPVAAASAATVPAPSSSRGARIEWKILQVKPRD